MHRVSLVYILKLILFSRIEYFIYIFHKLNLMSCIYFYQYTQARIPPESFPNVFETVAFSISMYQPVMHNHPKVFFSRHFGNKFRSKIYRVIVLSSAIPTNETRIWLFVVVLRHNITFSSEEFENVFI